MYGSLLVMNSRYWFRRMTKSLKAYLFSIVTKPAKAYSAPPLCTYGTVTALETVSLIRVRISVGGSDPGGPRPRCSTSPAAPVGKEADPCRTRRTRPLARSCHTGESGTHLGLKNGR